MRRHRVTLHRRSFLCAVAAAMFSSACADSAPSASLAPTLRGASDDDAARSMIFSSAAATVGFPIDLSAHSHFCRSREHHQFDFWLGIWDAHRTDNGALSGTDTVASRLDGCAVEERWIDGGRGRSLSAFDQSLGQWTQFWVYSGGGAFTPLLLQGDFVDGQMRMRYDRTSETGVFLPLPPAGVRFALSDDYTWFPEAGGSVIQQNMRSVDKQPATLAFQLRYERVPSVTPIPVGTTSVCQTRAQNREFDFMVGRWRIYATAARRGPPLGATTFTTDLGGCLVEEHVDAPGRYAGWSFNTWSVFTRQWHRTYVDNQGHRLAMAGGIVDGDMVLTGSEHTLFGPVSVRVTWHAVSAGEVRQTWEASFNAGATWPLRYAFTFVKE